ncbi:hypothetical protein [Gloeocapsa sp. PCC 7428]|uniref:hypothetical protein n=1 Tax=Gloeocapsa sp. PCC 7428 TaxID=1173026 RepID=UPI0012DDEC91|nr:hypothetical protein [Gloeocapsa sp. PCC 7428]
MDNNWQRNIAVFDCCGVGKLQLHQYNKFSQLDGNAMVIGCTLSYSTQILCDRSLLTSSSCPDQETLLPKL